MGLSAARASLAEAQNLRVVPVPWVATDATIPHQAYNGHATTFKAIARGGNGTYLYEWDFQGDGVFDFSVSTNNRYNLSTRFTYPNQAVTTTFQAKVRVTSNGQTVTGTYPVRVFADVPANPVNATDRQLQVMRSVAVDDGLWFLHNRMTRAGNEEDPLTGAQITGNISENTTASAASFLWTLSLNGHFAAFPAAYIGALPDAADNTLRFTTDPYAEDATRIVNYLLTNASVVTVTAADEANLSGFYPEVQKTPINGTDDLSGLYIGSGPGEQTVYYMGHAVSALSVSHLGGFVAQVGDSNRILGRRMEFVLQQLVDGLVWAQNDTAPAIGSWYYTPNANADDLSTSLWGLTGLWHADEFAGDQGVIVPNVAKARLAQYIQANLNTCSQGGTGGTYNSATANGTCDFTLSAAHVLTLGWVGSNTFAATDTRLAFPSYNAITRGNLRGWYDSSLAFINAAYTTGSTGSTNWNMGFVVGGDFTRTDGQANHYGMLHWQDASRAVEPEIVTYGTHNWAREFSSYFIRNQATDGGWNWVFSLGANSDNSGGVGLRAAWALLVLSPDAIPPLAIGTSSVTTAPEGTSIAFNGSASDPGTGNPVYTWAFGNGATQAGQNVNYAYPDNGNFNATLTSTSIGGVSVDDVPVVITNVAPVTNAGIDLTANEGDAVPVAMTFTDPGTADTWTFAWDFGDLTNGNAQNTTHTYADNGVYNVSARVTDDDGGTTQDILVATINNLPPTITSTPANTATEAVQYSYTIAFTDPGVADTHICTAPVRPAGSALVGCQLVWTPDFSQAVGAAAPVRMCVTDDDGGQTCQDYTIAVGFVDSDGDGLPDSWEVTNFGNITAQDQFGDPDGDGMNNLQEFTNVTDPNTYDGPNAATASAPTCGGEIASLQTSLVANNAVDPQGTALQYEFELYSDLGLTILVASQDNIPQGAGATTTWPVPVNLLENTHYYWRVRAEDQFTFGPYSTPSCSFFVNTVNEAPTVPRINTPAFGGQVNLLRPALVVDNATDPDEDVLTYTYEVYSDPALSTLVTSQTGVASGAGATTTWTVNLDLSEDSTYYWRARATDPDNLSGDWSQSGKFFVTTVNAPPEAPALVSPQNGTVMDSLRPDLVILNADDSDLDLLVYDWDLATDDSFATIVDSGTDEPAQGLVNTHFTLAADLTEDTRYCWRARSDDGAMTSLYNSACFLVSTENDPPSVPTLNNPSTGGSVPTQTPVYSWAPSTDPENENITYEVEVREGTTVVATVTGVSGTVTSMSGELENGGSYTWRARAHDQSGGVSAYSDDNAFTVDAPIDDPEVVVNGGGCQTGGTSTSTGGLLMVGLTLVGLLRRRRR